MNFFLSFLLINDKNISHIKQKEKIRLCVETILNNNFLFFKRKKNMKTHLPVIIYDNIDSCLFSSIKISKTH